MGERVAKEAEYSRSDLHLELSLYFEGKWHQLKQGESVRFIADQSHGYQAVSDTTTFQNIVCYPK